ncbi:MAG: LLM class flavin-dependent oxidoreductase [Alphaproteobacteria bacterium]|jgi:5,10-methylenetetrahydromethanopterin reductase|nr:LLM class flavin-dependent oxidoreductase [Alphaproteobacteria bacterium]
MSIGLLMLGNYPVQQMAGYAELAEANGYEAVWLGDERFYREVYACLGYFATRLWQIQLGPCVTDPYSRHPAMTAAAIQTLDEITGGRAMLAIGAGISGFAELGIERRRPARAIAEAVELIRALLAGEEVDYEGEVIRFNRGRLSFPGIRDAVPIYVASNGPLGQRTAGRVADGAIMEACASVDEVRAFRAKVDEGATAAGRDPAAIRLVARLNACIADDGAAARDAVRLGVARMLGAGRLKMATLEAQGLALPDAARAEVAGVAYTDGLEPYRPLLPLISDRHVDAFTLAGTADEVAQHVAELRRAGVDEIIILPFAAEGGSVEDTISRFGAEVWPAAEGAV